MKIKRSAVSMTRILTDVAGRNDWLLRRLFALAARDLPLAALGELRRPQPVVDSMLERETLPEREVVLEREPERARRRSIGSPAT